MSLAGLSKAWPSLTSVPRFYAVQALLRSVSPIIAAEEELGGKAISDGWASVDEKKLEEWSKAGEKSLRTKVKQLWDSTYDEEYTRLFRHVSTHCLWPRRDDPITPGSAFGVAKPQIRRD